MPYHFLISHFHFFPTFTWPHECAKQGLRVLKREGCTAQVLFGREGKVCRWKGAPLIFSLRKFIALTPGFPTSDVSQCNQTSRVSKSLCGSSIVDKKETFAPKMRLFLLRQRKGTKTNSTCTLSVAHHSLYPKMGPVQHAVLHVLWKQLV